MFILIAAIGRNRELGRQGELLFMIPEDMEFFRKTTIGHKILMGRKTWDSLPGKLRGRENIVVSHHDVLGADEVVTDLNQFIEENKNTSEEIFVIGGGAIYKELLPYAKEMYLTKVEAEEPKADTWFPDFDTTKYVSEVLGQGQNSDLKYQFLKYKLKEVK